MQWELKTSCDLLVKRLENECKCLITLLLFKCWLEIGCKSFSSMGWGEKWKFRVEHGKRFYDISWIFQLILIKNPLSSPIHSIPRWYISKIIYILIPWGETSHVFEINPANYWHISWLYILAQHTKKKSESRT